MDFRVDLRSDNDMYTLRILIPLLMVFVSLLLQHSVHGVVLENAPSAR